MKNPHTGHTTTAYDVMKGKKPPVPVAASRQHVALVPGSLAHLTVEVACLLRRRLRVAGLIGLGGFLAYFLKNLFQTTADGPAGVDLLLHGAVVASLVMMVGLLWTKIPLSMRSLRFVEAGMFGVMGLFFLYLQLSLFSNGRFLAWAKPEYESRMLSLGTYTSGMRWFLLIVLYGTFIPNTWKRCALVVGLMAVTPIGATLVGCGMCPVMHSYTPLMTFDLVVLLSLGSAIAIFGSYKISSLQAEAFAARKLGQYILQRKLGAGGMGEVYLGEHQLLRRACAIKLIRPDQAGDVTNLSRFEREVQAMATLTHWNSVEVYDFGRADDGTFYYVMEYLPGMSLQELVDTDGPLSPARAIHFLRQVCAALKEAHTVGLIHRDIKPSNVIACQRGGIYDVAKLLDFGLVQGFGVASKEDDKLTIQGTILGSPPYMSPEQAIAKGPVDHRTDIYSLGALAYFLVTGQPPFLRDSAMELLVAHIHSPVTPPRDLRQELPADLDEVIMRCLEKETRNRYQDIAELDRALADCELANDWEQDHASAWWEGRSSPVQNQRELVTQPV